MPRKYTKKKPMQQIDAKDWSAPAPTVVSAPYNELWGARVENFGTTNPEEFEHKLTFMDKADLQNVCIKLGLMPHDNRDTMKERIMRQFRIYVASSTVPTIQPKVLVPTKQDLEFLSIQKREWI